MMRLRALRSASIAPSDMIHRNFRLLWAGDALGQLSARATGIALPVIAVQVVGASAFEMSVIAASSTLGFLVLGLPAGAWVDRWAKRPVIVVSSLLRCAVLALVGVLALADLTSVPLLTATALVLGVALLFSDVAGQSFLPQLVAADSLTAANGRLQSTQSLARVIGPGVTGAVLRFATPGAVLVVSAMLAAIAAGTQGAIQADNDLPAHSEKPRLRSQIREGLSFVLRHPLLSRIVACTTLFNISSAFFAALGPIFALRTIALSPPNWGLVLSVGAVGGIAGALLSGRIVKRFGIPRVLLTAAAACAPATALTPLAAIPDAAYISGLILAAGNASLGFCVVVYNVAQVSLRQSLCPPELLGRMNASSRFISWGAVPVASLAAGWLASRTGIVPALWASASFALR
ncbi:Major Facilitator Superfamily transporter [Mycobacteroides abscessus subsp. abscessus]|nr:Major Facilitator Superfamily transporter [Mycobacteroides abscessus subsp. abscessus]